MEDHSDQYPEEPRHNNLFFPPAVLKAVALLVILAILVSNYLIWIQPLVQDWFFDPGAEETETPEGPFDPAEDFNVRRIRPARPPPAL